MFLWDNAYFLHFRSTKQLLKIIAIVFLKISLRHQAVKTRQKFKFM